MRPISVPGENNHVTISISTEFSKFPGGRYRSDGKFSGEEFRDDILVPALNGGQVVNIVLSGAAGYGSSFLEESFGGLIRKHNFTFKDLASQLHFDEDKNYKRYIDAIWRYIKTAEKNKH